MKFDCGETDEEFFKRNSEWHDFFTILPRKVADHDCRWLETIQRRREYRVAWGGGHWYVQYRAKEIKE